MRQLLISIILLISFNASAGSDLDYRKVEDIVLASQQKEWINLLHYQNNKSNVSDSSFFLSPDGKTNASNELSALIQEYTHPTRKGEERVECVFPARVDFLIQQFPNIKRKHSVCRGYNEYRNKVPADNVYVVFAAENNLSPSSMMGHLLLKLSGKVNNIKREHSFGFTAIFAENASFLIYAKMLLNIIDGYYVLAPYNTTEADYLEKEQRALWEFELALTSQEKEKLLKHLWELKQKTISYDFISHNCGGATMNLLDVAGMDVASKAMKPWTTPIEYVRLLLENNSIQNISLTPSSEYRSKMDKSGQIKDITNIPHSSKLSIGYQHNQYNYITLDFRPVYLDMNDITELYYDELETRLFAFETKYNLQKDNFLLDRIDVLKLKSLIDFYPNYVFSKHFQLSFENDLEATHTHLRPTAEIGFGVSASLSNGVRFYLLPRVGYRYNHTHNAYLVPEIGSVITFSSNIKTLLSFERYFDLKDNNRGYNQKLSGTLSYKISDDYSINLELNRYWDTKRNNQNEIWLKTNWHF